MPHLVERHAVVGGVLAWKVQDALADHVARHLGGAAADAADLAAQVAYADVELCRVVLDDGGGARYGMGGVGFDIVTRCHEQSDDRSRGATPGTLCHRVVAMAT